MNGRRWFWLLGTLCNALGIWRYFAFPDTIAFFWLAVWSICLIITLEAFISNRQLTWEKKHHGNHQ